MAAWLLEIFLGWGWTGRQSRCPCLDRRQNPALPGGLPGPHIHCTQTKAHNPNALEWYKGEFGGRPEGGEGVFSKTHCFGNAAFWQVSLVDGGESVDSCVCSLTPSFLPSVPGPRLAGCPPEGAARERGHR